MAERDPKTGRFPSRKRPPGQGESEAQREASRLVSVAYARDPTLQLAHVSEVLHVTTHLAVEEGDLSTTARLAATQLEAIGTASKQAGGKAPLTDDEEILRATTVLQFLAPERLVEAYRGGK